MRPLVILGVGVGFHFVAASAHADPRVAALEPPADPGGPPGMTAASEEPPRVDRAIASEPVIDQLARVSDADAMSDRAFGRSTAVALRPGDFDFSLRTAVQQGSMMSIAAGLGRGVELSIDAGYARQIGSDVGAGIKIEVVRHETWAASIDASLHTLRIDGNGGSLFSADAKLTRCASDCSVMFTGGAGFFAVSGGDAPPIPFLEMSLLFGTGVVRPMLEGVSFAGIVNFGFAGVRVGGRHVGIDVGVGAGGTLADEGDGGVAMMVGVGVRP